MVKLMNWFKKRNGTTPLQSVTQDEFQRFVFQDRYVPLNRHPDVMIAVDKIADLVSSMTIHLMENTEDGDVRIRDGLARKIDVEPCRFMTRKSWMYKIVRDLLVDGQGNSIVHIGYDEETGMIADLTPFTMSEVTYDVKDDTYVIQYQKATYTPDEVIHFVLNPDARSYWRGTGYQVVLKDIVANLTLATQIKKGFMRNRNMPSLIIKVDALNNEMSSKEGRRKIVQKYLETDEVGEPWVIPSDLLEVTQVKPMTLNDIALNESVELDKKTVAGMLGVPAFFLGVGAFNREEYNHFVNTRIMAIAQIVAQTLTRDILVSPTRYFKLNPRSLYAYNLSELVKAGSEMVQLSALRRNELRDWIGLPPDSEMSDLIVLENYLPQEELGNQKKLKGGE